jgi:hypothetical protein
MVSFYPQASDLTGSSLKGPRALPYLCSQVYNHLWPGSLLFLQWLCHSQSFLTVSAILLTSLSLKCVGIITCGAVQEASSPSIIATDVEIQEQMNSNSHVTAWQNKNLYWGIKAVNIPQGSYLQACSWHLEWHSLEPLHCQHAVLNAGCKEAGITEGSGRDMWEGEGSDVGLYQWESGDKKPFCPTVITVTKSPWPTHSCSKPPRKLACDKSPVLARGSSRFVAHLPSAWQACDSSRVCAPGGKVLWAEKRREGTAWGCPQGCVWARSNRLQRCRAQAESSEEIQLAIQRSGECY